jgi:glycosyltransferase involved in cell wall biosynthesis
LRILLLHRHFSPHAGGAERYVHQLATGLAKKHHEIHVLAQWIHQAPQAPQAPQNTSPCVGDIHGIHIHHTPYRLRRPSWLNQWLYAWCCRRFIQQETRQGRRFDLIHSHENVSVGHVQTFHVRPVRWAFLQTKTWKNRLSRWLSPRWQTYLRLEAARLRAAKAVVSVSSTVQDQLRQAYPFLPHQNDQKQQVVIPPAVEPAENPLSPLADQQVHALEIDNPLNNLTHLPTRYLLFVANDYRKKGLSVLLEALALLDTREIGTVVLWVVGQPAQQAEFEEQAQRLDLNLNLGVSAKKSVRFWGVQADLSPFYAAADALIHPTLEDTFAMVVLEAMAANLPVVVSVAPYCGLSAQLKDRQEALLLHHPRDATELAKHIHTVLANDTLRHHLIAQGRSLANAHNIDNLISSHENLYQSILSCSASFQPT